MVVGLVVRDLAARVTSPPPDSQRTHDPVGRCTWALALFRGALGEASRSGGYGLTARSVVTSSMLRSQSPVAEHRKSTRSSMRARSLARLRVITGSW